MWGNPAQQPYRFGAAWGYLRDPSELVQLGARWYWPEIGRFIQQDPARDGVNWYAYVNNDPLTGIDPEGLAEISFDAFAGVGAGFTVGYQRGRGFFFKARAGFGARIAGALSLDPSAPSPGTTYCVPTSGSQVGLVGSAGLKIYHVGKDVKYSIGTAYDNRGNSYIGPPRGKFSSPNKVKLPIGFNFGGSIAAEGSFFQ
jgi:RHS repeat-associated protein